MTHYMIHAWNQHGVERDYGPFTAIQVLFGEVRVDSPEGTPHDEYARLDEGGYWVFRDGIVAEGWSVEATAVLVEPEDETPEDEVIILGPAEADALAQQEGYPTADALVGANDRGAFHPVLGPFPRAMRDVDLQDAEGAP